MSFVSLTTLGTQIVDEAFLTKQSAYFLIVLATGGSVSAILAAFNLFVESAIIEEVGIVGVGILLSVHYRYRC